MQPALAASLTAVGLFAATNVDDLVVLAVLGVSSRTAGRPRPWEIWAGQYLGLAALVMISLLAASGLTLLPDRWIWLLGLLPLLLGVRKLVLAIRTSRGDEETEPAGATGLPGVVGLTIANGGDNVAAYTPVLRADSPSATAVTLGVFAVGTALWCVIGTRLMSHRAISELIRRQATWVVAGAYILIGLWVIRSGAGPGG